MAADSKRPRTASTTLTFPTMSCSPCGVTAWMRKVRRLRDCNGSALVRSSASTGFHLASRPADCATASRYGTMSCARTVRTHTRAPLVCSASSSDDGTTGSKDNFTPHHDVLRRRQDRDILARIRLVDHQISTCTLVKTRPVQPPAGTPAGGRQCLSGGHPRFDQLGHLLGYQTVRQGPAGVGAHKNGHTGVMCSRDGLVT